MTKELEKQTPQDGTQPETPTDEKEVKQEGGEPTPPSNPEEPETPKSPESPETPEPETPAEPPKPEAPKEPTEPTTPPAEPDYKQKFAGSTRENQILTGNLKELQKQLGELTKEDIPTDDEMARMDPDWNVRSDYEKNLAIKIEASARMQRRIAQTVNGFVSKSEKVQELNQLVQSDPRLHGKENDFFAFVQKPKHQNTPLDVLVNAFLFDTNAVPETPPAPAPEEPAPAPATPPSLNRSTPSGGTPPVQKKEGEFSNEELKHLRTTDPKKYNEMIRKGQIQ
tara:strand:+ start:562 stop:1407 length:846 start_codon:yes stop_codon:yes gene_type:complete